MNFFCFLGWADTCSPARHLRIFKFFPIQSFQSIHPTWLCVVDASIREVAWCLIQGKICKCKWSAGSFSYATPISALQWRLEDALPERHSTVCSSCWPSSTCIQFVPFFTQQMQHPQQQWMLGPDGGKMMGTVVLGNGCRSTIWRPVLWQQCWRFQSSRVNCDSQWFWAPTNLCPQEIPRPICKERAENFVRCLPWFHPFVQFCVMNAFFLNRIP